MTAEPELNQNQTGEVQGTEAGQGLEPGVRREPFELKDCHLLSIATGASAQTLREFREALLWIHQDSIYHHFWGRLLQPHFDEPEYNNDFAAWAFHGLDDRTLAERLAVIDPSDYDDIEELRQEVVEIVEARLDESELLAWARADAPFHFIRAQLVVLNTGLKLTEPAQLCRAVPEMSRGGIFYHFIDARNRTDNRDDDFTAWLFGFGTEYEDLIKELVSVDPYFSSLKELQRKLASIFETYFRGVTS